MPPAGCVLSCGSEILILFVPLQGLHADLMVEDTLAQAEVFGGDLQQLVVSQELQALLQAHGILKKKEGCL